MGSYGRLRMLLCAAAVAVVVPVTGAAVADADGPVDLTPPVVTGIAQVGGLLGTDSGTWDTDALTFADQWQDCDRSGTSCRDIAGATVATYQPAASDTGWRLRVEVTATDPITAATGTAESTLTAAVWPAGYRLTPTSPDACPTQRLVVPAADGFRSNASATTFDATAEVWNQRAGVVDYSVQTNKSGGSGDCWLGGQISGTNSPLLTWNRLKGCCNGAGLYPWRGLSAFGVRMDDVAVDDVRQLNADGNDSAYITGSHFTNTRDDCFSTAHAALMVEDTLAECYTVISWRNTGKSNVPFPVTLSGDLLYLKSQPSGSENKCPSQLVNGTGSGQVWKMDSFKGTPALINVTDTIFRVDHGNDMTCLLTWPTGTFSNDTVVWTGSGSYPGKLPAGVTLTTDISVWDDAVATWLGNHPGM